MEAKSPQEEVAGKISALQNDLQSLHSKVRLSGIQDAVAGLENTILTFSNHIRELRSRNYVFEKKLEETASGMSRRWNSMKSNVRLKIEQETAQLQKDIPVIESQMTRLVAQRGSPTSAQGIISQVENNINNLESKVTSAENTIRNLYSDLENEVNNLKRHLDKIEWMLTQLEEASFKLLATEAGVMAVEAILIQGNKEEKDDPEGVLFLTDQRLIFEQKEKVATKKVLFVTTASELVQKVLMEASVSLAENISATKKGLFKNEDHLEIDFGRGAPLPKCWLHLKGQDCQEWRQLIEMVKTGDIDKERSVKIDQTVVEKVKEAPTICPQCGGQITQPVLRGQDSMTCEYCGFVIRL